MIAKTRAKFSLNVSTNASYKICYQESGWLPLPVAHQITRNTDFP